MLEKVSNSDLKFMKGWISTKAMGKWKFAFVQGIIYGIILFIVTSLFELEEFAFNEVFLSSNGLIKLFFWLIFGVFGYGIGMWYLNNFLFKKRLSKYNITESDIINSDKLN